MDKCTECGSQKFYCSGLVCAECFADSTPEWGTVDNPCSGVDFGTPPIPERKADAPRFAWICTLRTILRSFMR